LILAALTGIALAVGPARATLIAPAAKALDVSNRGTAGIVVSVENAPAPWLQIRPRLLVLAPGAHRRLTVRARADMRARPGDHELLLMLLARPQQRARITVRMRVGVRLRVRMPGRLERRIVVRGVRVRKTGRRRLLLVALANAGNVTEPLRGRVTVTLLRAGRLVSRLRYGGSREIFPGARAVVSLPYRGGVRGAVDAVVRAGTVQRRYRLRI
jgi:hypothetical protein